LPLHGGNNMVLAKLGFLANPCHDAKVGNYRDTKRMQIFICHKLKMAIGWPRASPAT
jgi:hypothetical protein